MSKVTIATVWFDGCSGCHMSFLDLDEHLIDLADKIEVLYSPLVDNKEFPEEVDVTLVEGAISSDEDLEKIRHIRQHTKILVALGDCAVTGNVPAMRNWFKLDELMQRAYFENASENQQMPQEVVPALLKRVQPVNQIVEVDVFVPGCPPSADLILHVVGELLEGKQPDLSNIAHFG